MSSDKKPKYFEEALSDFTHDVASGGAIRHLVDLGYSTDQIMKKLDFPTPRARVEKTVYRYMTESGILLESLPVPEEELKRVHLPGKGRPEGKRRAEICVFLRNAIEQNGEENSYVSCPFGTWRRDREQRLNEAFSCLTGREKEYLLGIPWPMQTVYHRLNDRMAEIGMQLAFGGHAGLCFYFLKTEQMIVF